jgi:hypothetical protein
VPPAEAAFATSTPSLKPYDIARSYRVVLSGQRPVVDVPLSPPPQPASHRPQRRIEAALQCMKIISVRVVSVLGNWWCAIGRIKENKEGSPGDAWLGHSMVIMRVWDE